MVRAASKAERNLDLTGSLCTEIAEEIKTFLQRRKTSPSGSTILVAQCHQATPQGVRLLSL